MLVVAIRATLDLTIVRGGQSGLGIGPHGRPAHNEYCLNALII
jgi:hypothetical protein